MISNRTELSASRHHETALACLEVGLRASAPDRAMRETITLSGTDLSLSGTSYDLAAFDDIVVVGGGKAGLEQARALEAILGDRITDGLIVTRESGSLSSISVREGDHPVPTDRNVSATAEMRELVAGVDQQTLVIALISGGGSALLCSPASGVSLESMQSVTEALLGSGASIDEINAVRKHLSAIKGGRLAEAAAPARTVSLLLSDVVGDDPAVIASGPTVPDPTTYADAIAVLDRYDIDAPADVTGRLEKGRTESVSETPAAGAACFEQSSVHIIATNLTALEAMERSMRDSPYDSVILSSRITGESETVGTVHAGIAADVAAAGYPLEPPAVLLSGGETTVSLTGDGTGGPNHECALGAALKLSEGSVFAALDSDGIDGNSPTAGGIVTSDVVADSGTAIAALHRNDAYTYLSDRGATIETGPTGTNVNDLRVLVVGDESIETPSDDPEGILPSDVVGE